MTNVLSKIFAHGFYKVNSGFLVFLFGILLSYCLFINTAGDITLMSPAKVLYYNFIILINFAGSPIITGIFFIGWLAYTIKSWFYVSGQLKLVQHQFLFYSALSYSRLAQFKSWFNVQLIISLPFVVYVVIASINGLIFHHYLIVAVIWVFTLLLISVSALKYVFQINQLVDAKRSSRFSGLSSKWSKPFFSLFMYYVADRLKLGYIITKLLSYFIIVGLFFSLADVKTDPRVAALIVLGIVTAHAILIYQQHRFEEVYLSTLWNLPFSVSRTYLRYMVGFILLLLPEEIWIFINFNIINAAGLLLTLLGMVMLFHSLIYKTGLFMNRYIRSVSVLFFILSLFILFGWMWILAPGCTLIAFVMMKPRLTR
jgi:hypothetical protein